MLIQRYDMIKNIYCKSSMAKEQLEHRKSLNINGVELQLLGDFVYEPLEAEEYLNNIKPYIDSIKAVHVPLKRGEELMEIQMLDDKKSQELFYKICSLAQAIAKTNGDDILIIIHNRWTLDDLRFHQDSYNKIVNCLKTALKNYPNIKIAIENVIPFLIGKKDFSNGCLPNYVDVVHDLRRVLNTDRIGSVIDTCHAWVTIGFYETIEQNESIGLSLSMEDFFEANEGICFLLHLCDVNGFGYKKESHGITFTEETKYKLEEILNLYKKYTQNAAVTIEVLESDYTNCVNYTKTRKMIDELL